MTTSRSGTMAAGLALAIAAATSLASAPAPTPRVLAHWDFEGGLGDWHDDPGHISLGGVLGHDLSTALVDPRRGWQVDPDGRDGTTGLRGRRVNQPLPGRQANGPVATYLTSRSITVSRGTRTVVVDLWYRWDAGGTDQVVVRLLRGWTTIAEVTLSRDDPATSGGWHHLELPVDVTEFADTENMFVRVRLTSIFEQPMADCVAGTVVLMTNRSCDLGFTFDDVTVTRWKVDD